MNKTNFLFGIALFSATLALTIPAEAKSDGLAKADRDAEMAKPEYYGPAAQFDPAQAKQMLAKGNATIRGALFHKINEYGYQPGPLVPGGPARPAAGIMVHLYPATPHLIEWQQLFVKYRGKNKITQKPGIIGLIEGRKRPRILQYDNRMGEVRLSVKSDEYGRFSFEQMKPGRYYITTTADISGSYQGTEVSGNSTAYDIYGAYNVQHTRPVERRYRTSVFFEKFVDITDGQNMVEVDAKMKAVDWD